MSAKLIQNKFKRPEKLSDPLHDFTPDMLSDLLRKDDADFQRVEFLRLFDPHFPAGTYKEVMYFLPMAFAYLRNNDDEALDLVSLILGYCSKNADQLKVDGIALEVRAEIERCFQYWMGDFIIEHFDKSGCVAKGWGRDYFDYVHNSEVVCEALTELVRFEGLSNVAFELVNSLAHHGGDITKASWFLEISRSRFDVYTPPNTPEFQQLLSDKELLDRACTAVWPEVIDYKLTYWKDAFNKIGV